LFTDCEAEHGCQKFHKPCFKVVSTQKTWEEARQHCEDLGSILATIHSKEENNFVLSLMNDGQRTIGASDTASEGNWVWLDGEDWGRFEFWGGSNPNGQENENCLMISDGVWNDAPCDLKRHYICKTEKSA